MFNLGAEKKEKERERDGGRDGDGRREGKIEKDEISLGNFESCEGKPTHCI